MVGGRCRHIVYPDANYFLKLKKKKNLNKGTKLIRCHFLFKSVSISVYAIMLQGNVNLKMVIKIINGFLPLIMYIFLTSEMQVSKSCLINVILTFCFYLFQLSFLFSFYHAGNFS